MLVWSRSGLNLLLYLRYAWTSEDIRGVRRFNFYSMMKKGRLISDSDISSFHPSFPFLPYLILSFIILIIIKLTIR